MNIIERNISVVMATENLNALGKAMMSAACSRLLKLGHSRAYLVTLTARIPAINLYLQFGFQPSPRNDEERATWQELRPHLTRS